VAKSNSEAGKIHRISLANGYSCLGSLSNDLNLIILLYRNAIIQMGRPGKPTDGLFQWNSGRRKRIMPHLFSHVRLSK
jgi:hypothetical protein